MRLRIVRYSLGLARAAAVVAGVFAAFALVGYLVLILWDRTHVPSLPGFKAEMSAARPTARAPGATSRP